MKKYLFLALAAIVGLAFLMQTQDHEAHAVVDQQEFIKLYEQNKDNALLIDVRTKNEYNRGKILEAVNIDFYSADFEEQIAQLDTSKMAFIYCQSGGRSGKASSTFITKGFKIVYDLKGGYGRFKK